MKITSLRLPVAISATAIASLALLHTASAVDVPTTDDAVVIQGAPNAPFNFGANGTIQINGTVNALRHSYLRFAPISYYLPAGTRADDISQALLHLYVTTVTTAGQMNVSLVAASPVWTEGKANGAVSGTDICWSNKPAATGTPIVTPTIAAAQVNEFVTIDVTTWVKDWLTTPANNTGLVLTPVGTTTVVFYSKEGGFNRPVLDITLVKKRTLQLGDVSMGSFTVGPLP